MPPNYVGLGASAVNVWLCFIKPRNWYIVRREEVFGVSSTARKTISRVRPGDFLVFHVMKPVNGIVAVYTVTSEVFEDNRKLRRFPFKIKIKPVPGLVKNESQSIPLSHLMGKVNEDVEVFPLFKGMSLIQISDRQFRKLERMFKESLDFRVFE